MFNVSLAAAAGERGVRRKNMNSHSGPFCNQLNDAGGLVENAGLDDLNRAIDRMRSSGEFRLTLRRTSDRDSGIDLISTAQGTAIFGCEDSLRGTFGFYYYDSTKTAKLVPVEIYEVPMYAHCDEIENAIKIAEVYFREGELDRRFSWMVDVDIGNGVKRDNLLAAGDIVPLEAFIARVKQKQTA